MKRILSTVLALGFVLSAAAQAPAQVGYTFTDTKTIRTTPVKDQSRSGTCWCYSGLTFLEDEILRNGGEEMHLSEMWIVRNGLMDRAIKYVRLHGNLNFAEGGAFHDVTEGIKAHGIVPFEAYRGLNYGTEKPNFNELRLTLKAYLDAVIAAGEKPGQNLSSAWQRGFNALLDQYFGPMPETFTYKGKQFTPQSFAASLPIRMEDYVTLTSFTHHPFYSQFIFEVPDNWMWGTVYNIPLNELMDVINKSLENDYTIAWATDVSEKGFSRTKAIGIIPEADTEGMGGTEAEKWGKLSETEKDAALFQFDKPGKEKSITQQNRQEAFENYQTTDDHGMVIIGTAEDQAGNKYYKVQNSWDVRAPYDGFFYFSRPFVEYKTMTVMVNKNAIPKEIRKKLEI